MDGVAPHSSPAFIEASWALGAVSGSREDFERLVRATARATYAELVVLTGDAGVAEDLTQETYLRAWRNIRSLHDPASFRPWLAALGRTAAYDAHRAGSRKKRGRRGAVLEDSPDPHPQPAERAVESECRERALAALANLPSPHRQALTLRYLHDADRAQITRDLGLSDGALRGVLGRGLALLREALAERGST